MTDWVGFVGFTGVVLTLMLGLAWTSRNAIQTETETTEQDHEAAVREFNRVMGGPAPGPGEPQPREGHLRPRDRPRDDRDARTEATAGAKRPESTPPATAEGRTVDEDTAIAEDRTVDEGTAIAEDRTAAESGATRDEPADEVSEGTADVDSLSTGVLLANVVITQGLFFGMLAIGIWWTRVPAVAIGLASPGTVLPSVATTSLGWSPTAIVLGIALGAALYVFNQVGAAIGNRVGVDSSTALREALAPASATGWVGLLGVALPVVAVFEELLFRGVLIGGFAIASIELGMAVTPWLLVVGSAVAFALGHGAQGRGGIVVTGTLGAVLGAAFVLSWSLPLVIVAHYVVNALEFVIHEGFGIDWI